MLFPSITHRCPRLDLSKQWTPMTWIACAGIDSVGAETGVYEAGPVAVLHLIIIHGTTPPKTNMEAKNDDLEGVFSFSNGWFSGSMLNFGGVTGPGYLESSVSLQRPAEVSCCQWNLSTYLPCFYGGPHFQQRGLPRWAPFSCLLLCTCILGFLKLL